MNAEFAKIMQEFNQTSREEQERLRREFEAEQAKKTLAYADLSDAQMEALTTLDETTQQYVMERAVAGDVNALRMMVVES